MRMFFSNVYTTHLFITGCRQFVLFSPVYDVYGRGSLCRIIKENLPTTLAAGGANNRRSKTSHSFISTACALPIGYRK